jgi:hypothetical protein
MNEIEKLEVEMKLTVAHVNTILAHLAKGVYAEVADLINHLRNQAVPQVTAAQEQALDAQKPAEDPAPVEQNP